jgi:hypothetical protein
MSKPMRAKVSVTEVTLHGGSETVVMHPVYGGDTNSEDNTYSQATPSGKLELCITNPALAGIYKPGQRFYVDFTPIE